MKNMRHVNATVEDEDYAEVNASTKIILLPIKRS